MKERLAGSFIQRIAPELELSGLGVWLIQCLTFLTMGACGEVPSPWKRIQPPLNPGVLTQSLITSISLVNAASGTAASQLLTSSGRTSAAFELIHVLRIHMAVA